MRWRWVISDDLSNSFFFSWVMWFNTAWSFFKLCVIYQHWDVYLALIVYGVFTNWHVRKILALVEMSTSSIVLVCGASLATRCNTLQYAATHCNMSSIPPVLRFLAHGVFWIFWDFWLFLSPFFAILLSDFFLRWYNLKKRQIHEENVVRTFVFHGCWRVNT